MILLLRNIALVGLLIVTTFPVFAQMRLGEWRDHLAYVQGTGIVAEQDRVYVSSNSGIFVYNRTDNSLERFSKVNRLSDINITAMYSDEESGLFVVGYQSGNIDLLWGNQTINMPDIVRANLIGSKTVNNFTEHNGLLYTSCGFGIIVLDPNREEIRNTFFIGPNSGVLNVRDIIVFENHFWAFTESGIFKAPTTGVNLANFQNWQLQTAGTNPNGEVTFAGASENALYAVFRGTENNDQVVKYQNGMWQPFALPSNFAVRHLTVENNQILLSVNQKVIILSEEGTVLKETPQIADGWFVDPSGASFTTDGTLWVSDVANGLVAFYPNNQVEVIAPNGPFYADAYRMNIEGDYVYVASGGTNEAWNSLQSTLGYYYLNPQGKWTSVNKFNLPWFDIAMDILYVLPNPKRPQNHFVCSYFSGLFEFEGAEFVERFWGQNSTLVNTPTWNIWTGVPFAMFDSQDRMWVTNCRVAEPISVRKTDGTWKSFTTGGRVGGDLILTDIMETQSGHLWILSPKQSNATRGILVFDHNNTIDNTQDDRYVLLNGDPGRGGLQSDVFCFAEDKNGVIWAGTEQGIEVFFNPAAAFSGNINAQRILIEQDGNIQFLLVTETINSIEVDGGNRKWVGTQRSGAFLFSEDGQRQIHHFTIDNSPLPSNNVFDIKVNDRTGEVFFATEAGIVSFMGDATSTPDDRIGKIEVYPNPVTPDFDGRIAIRGFALGSNVKITDISGNIVYQTQSNGGQATWDGTNLRGERVSTGVYLVFGTDREGEQTATGKILFVR
jgi:hypothetical protein